MKSGTGRATPLEAEGEDGALALGEVPLRQGVLGVVGKAGVAHQADLGVAGQEARHRLGVGDVAVHAQRQCFDPLEEEEGVERGQGGPQIAELFDSQLGAEAILAEVFPEASGCRRLATGSVMAGEPPGTPVEAAALHYHPPQAASMATDELGRRVDDDVGAESKGAAQIRGGHGRVDRQGEAWVVGDVGQGGERSATTPEGLPTTSVYTSLVLGRMAAAKASGSSGATKVVSMPSRARVTSSSVRVPPYRAADETMWSPAPATAHREQDRSAVRSPLAVATAPIPPSRLARRSSKQATVGLASGRRCSRTSGGRRGRRRRRCPRTRSWWSGTWARLGRRWWGRAGCRRAAPWFGIPSSVPATSVSPRSSTCTVATVASVPDGDRRGPARAHAARYGTRRDWSRTAPGAAAPV